MVHEAEQQAIEARRQTFQGGLNGSDLALFPIRIDYDFVGVKMDGSGDGFGVRAEDDAAGGNFGMARGFQQMVEETGVPDRGAALLAHPSG